MGYALPSGVVNTDSAYFYADNTYTLGPLVKQLADQTLVVFNASPITFVSNSFTIDVSSNPALVVSYPLIDATRTVLSFLVSGGIAGQQYNIAIHSSTSTGSRIDVLTVNIPSSGDCECETINPVPAIYTQLPVGEPTQGYSNTAVRYFWGNAPPSNPGVMDQWYDTVNDILYEWATDGVEYFWQLLMSASLVSDAPLNNIYYTRYNGNWVADPIQADAPATSQFYSRNNHTWALNPIQADAPNDANMYVRKGNGWIILPQQPILSDAPVDGKTYGRLNATWAAIPAPVILTDAPAGNVYLRTQGSWQSGGTLTGTLTVAGNLITNASLSVGTTMFVGGVATFGAQVGLAVDPISAMQAATKQYVDNSILNAFNVNGSPFLRLAGGTMNGPIVLSADPAAPMQPVTLQYFNAHSAAGLTDAVADGTIYGRMNHTWVNVLPLTGGTLTGALTLAGNPTVANGAANKAYVDSSITASVPQPSGSVPAMNGVGAVGVSSYYARADHVHPTDTSLYPASNPSNYQTAAQVTASLANYYPTSNPAGYQTAAQVSASLSNYYPNTNPAGYQTAAQVTAALAPYALTANVPAASTASPLMNGLASVGSLGSWSRGDHVHPSDTTKLNISGGTMTGVLTLVGNPTNPLDAATKQYVDNLVIDAGTF